MCVCTCSGLPSAYHSYNYTYINIYNLMVNCACLTCHSQLQARMEQLRITLTVVNFLVGGTVYTVFFSKPIMPHHRQPTMNLIREILGFVKIMTIQSYFHDSCDHRSEHYSTLIDSINFDTNFIKFWELTSILFGCAFNSHSSRFNS